MSRTAPARSPGRAQQDAAIQIVWACCCAPTRPPNASILWVAGWGSGPVQTEPDML
jgi:hypothetical protein